MTSVLLIEGLRWRRGAHQREAHGAECLRFACISEPRVFLLMQRTGPDAAWVESFHVDGIPAQYWHSAREAVEAAEANP